MANLEKILKNAKSLSDIQGVYWSARDMVGSPVGNHHFITFVYENEEQAKRITKAAGTSYFKERNDAGLQIFFSTTGATSDNGKLSGKVIFNFNYKADEQALNEASSDDNTSWYTPDYDYEGHKIDINDSAEKFKNNEELMKAIYQSVSNFNAQYKVGNKVDYALANENCACMVNALFKELGFSRDSRIKYGEFSGIDWGEEDTIAGWYFNSIEEAPNQYIGNSNTKELHKESCQWVSQMSDEHKVHFNTITDALSKGYNGCHFCLDEYDEK